MQGAGVSRVRARVRASTHEGLHAARVEQRLKRAKKLRKYKIDHDDRKETCHETLGGCAPHAGCAARTGEALVTTDQGDRETKRDALGDAGCWVPRRDELGGVVPVVCVRDAEVARDDCPRAK